MQPFTTLRGIAAPLLRTNINTDAIIPSIWLRAPDGNLADGLFGSLRKGVDGRIDPGFVLNRSPFDRARILVAGPNFGCGSSREAAVWALQDFGIACVVAPSFADIFYENAFKNGLLPAIVTEAAAEALCHWLDAAADPVLIVDLATQSLGRDGQPAIGFDIPAARKAAMLAGADELTELLQFLPVTQKFQQEDRARHPWIYLPAYPGADRTGEA